MQKSTLLQQICKRIISRQCILSQYRNYFVAVHLPTCVKRNINTAIISRIQLSFLRFTQHSNVLKCWKCGADRNSITDLTCDKCNIIQQPPESKNYFHVFNIEQDYDIDQKSLTTKYRKLQTILHPDKFSNKSNEEKAISADYSALVNKAYSTLQAPLSRALHMLRLHGEEIDEDQKVTDPELLMEIMELNEEVEAAVSPEQLKRLNDKNKDELESIGKEISDYFREKRVDKAKEGVIRMKYYNSVRLHINGLLRERGIVD